MRRRGVPLQVHHVRPLVAGGPELAPIDELLALCFDCHRHRSSRTVQKISNLEILITAPSVTDSPHRATAIGDGSRQPPAYLTRQEAAA